MAKHDVTFELAIEAIDIGGPSMLRSAAKNHAAVSVVVDAADYDCVLIRWAMKRLRKSFAAACQGISTHRSIRRRHCLLP